VVTNTSSAFDPFNDRLSRDLRNDLSGALLAAIALGTANPIEDIATHYRQYSNLGKARDSYLVSRQACYLSVLAAISAKPTDNELIALLLWNHELFFELHEFLEQSWLVAKGTEKLLLQALIRAAGVYVHCQSGRHESAIKMAIRARDTIKQIQEELPLGFPADKLLDALADPLAPPPQFGVLPTTPVHCRHVGNTQKTGKNQG